VVPDTPLDGRGECRLVPGDDRVHRLAEDPDILFPAFTDLGPEPLESRVWLVLE
jgi:hypothetical protein